MRAFSAFLSVVPLIAGGDDDDESWQVSVTCPDNSGQFVPRRRIVHLPTLAQKSLLFLDAMVPFIGQVWSKLVNKRHLLINEIPSGVFVCVLFCRLNLQFIVLEL